MMRDDCDYDEWDQSSWLEWIGRDFERDRVCEIDSMERYWTVQLYQIKKGGDKKKR